MKSVMASELKELATKPVETVEAAFLSEPQVECPVIHRFGPGVYMREVMIPAGSLAIGHHQNFEHTNVFLKGRVTILNDDGSQVEMKAPMIFVGKPGRKIGFIHEDMVWLNVYSTTETDVEKLEAHFLTKSGAFLNHAQSEGLKLLPGVVDRDDFAQVVKELGLTEKQVRDQSENLFDLIDLPFGNYKIKKGKSNIEGIGLFATADIEPGEIIAPARIIGKRTIAGRFTNHSKNPNAQMVSGIDGDIYLAAITKITGCRGGQDGEEITINYKDAFHLNLKLGTGA